MRESWTPTQRAAIAEELRKIIMFDDEPALELHTVEVKESDVFEQSWIIFSHVTDHEDNCERTYLTIVDADGSVSVTETN